MFNIFEQPWLLVAIAAMAFIAQRVLYAINPKKWPNRYLLVPIVIIGLAFLLDFVVSTDNEKVELLITTVRNGAVNEDLSKIRPLISDDYSDGFHGDKEYAMAHLDALFQVAPIKNAVIVEKHKDIDDSSASVKLKILILFSEGSQISAASVVVSIDLIKNRANQWLICSSKLYEINKQPVEWQNLP